MARALAVGWSVVIFIGCSLPAQGLPQDPALSYDKAAHFVLFAGFGFLWMAALSARLAKRIVGVLLAGGTFAVALEIYQALLPVLHRSGDLLDVVADLLGLIAGIGVFYWWTRVHGT